ncbi:CRTAC1 family protein [Roseiconus lacunae]|uniref:CRTAC1 family protein n=1 Tax=Roseiconus lacunae TaxID=2605694 RepID=UPI001E3C30F8|nr:CRTAC1 family protein [Roseiconus lacunae]MCD0460702.1 CRTAC1 family protein [Roseiconus lacunae]
MNRFSILFLRDLTEIGFMHRSHIAVFALCLFTALGTSSGCRKKTANTNGTTPGRSGESEATLVKLNKALAATENLETDQAITLWQQLGQQLPEDPSVELNRALASVLQVDALTSVATDSVKTKDEQRAARSQLPNAIDVARSAIEAYQNVSGDDVTKLWLAARIDAHEAALLGTTIGKSLRRELLSRLTQAMTGAIGQDPNAVILGGPLVELLDKMSDPVDGLPEQVRRPATVALKQLSDTNPDNLFVAMQALRLAIESQEKTAAALVDRTWQLAAAVEPTLRAYTKPIGIEPKELADRIKAAIESGDWAKANQSYVLWSNVLNPLEIVRTDRRRANPHPLDRLNFDAVRRLSTEITKTAPLAASRDTLTFDSDDIALAGTVTTVLAIDFDLDLDLDLAVVTADGKLQLIENASDQWTAFATLDLGEQVSGMIAADLFMVDSSDTDRIKQSQPPASDQNGDAGKAAVSKARHNTFQGIVVFGEFGLQMIGVDARKSSDSSQRLRRLEIETGLESVGAVTAAIAGDLEGDGDLDLIVATRSDGLRTFINRGNRTFFEAPVATSTVPTDDPIVDMAIGDLDRDIDLDVVAIHRSGRISQLENLLHLQFRHRELSEVPALPVGDDQHALSIAIEDIDANVGWDIVATSDQQSLIAFANSSDIGVWSVDRVETGPGFSSQPALADLDGDSYFELVAKNAFTRLGPWGIARLDQAPNIPAGNLIAGDTNNDGVVDLVSIDGELKVHRNRVGGQGKSTVGGFVKVRFKGIADNAAASGRVNHYAIGSVLELRSGPYYRSRIVTSPETYFGLDGLKSIDSIRVIMPNGLTQTLRDPKINSVIEEEQTLKGSCPYLYSWDGEKFAFQTDCLWAAPLGLQVAAGVVQQDRPWEYLMLDGQSIAKNADGNYDLRLTEELWEVAYVDHVELIAVDHPEDIQVWTNEKVGPPTIATPTVFAFQEDGRFALENAVGTTGQDIISLLLKSDENYVKGFDRRIRQGLCPPHWIDLDFGDRGAKGVQKAKAEQRVCLILRGWILPTDTSLNIQIDQNPELPPIEFPSVWVPQESGSDEWTEVIEFMGFPGGKTKTIVVDVTEHLLKDDPRFRVRTSAQIYWDSAELAITELGADVIQQALPLRQASLAYHGFSARQKTSDLHPETYDYSNASQEPRWPPLRGAITSFGECTDKLRQWDDQMVVISGGDEIQMLFKAPPNDPPEGYRRDFILHCVGWDKDADLNTLTGQEIGPLPIRDMRSYPPTLASSDQFEAVRSSHQDSRRRRQSFRAFWRRPQQTGAPFLPLNAPPALP